MRRDVEEAAPRPHPGSTEERLEESASERSGTFVPDDEPAGKPTRVVRFGEQGLPCGGTHVAHLGAVGHITIRKVKAERGDSVRIGYDITR